jgi:phage-related protein (TIGR01555 family)
MAFNLNITDTLINFLSKLGTKSDKSTAARYAMLGQLDRSQLDMAYRTDWIARKVIDIPAADATRAWRAYQADKIDVQKIEDVEKHFKVQQKVKEAQIRSRLYGGAAIIIGTNDGDMSKPLDVEKVGVEGLKFVHVVNRYEIGAGPLIQDIMDPDFGKPEYYSRNLAIGGQVNIHPSRVVVFRGAEMPDITLTGDGWGDSVLQIVDDACKAAGLVLQSAAVMVQEANFDVLKIPGLTAQITTDEYEKRMLKRMAFTSNAKSVVNGILIDKEEEWERINANFAGLPDILRVYLMVASGAADIPATRFVGQSPVGMNATGDSDTRNYYDRISSDQRTTIEPAMNPLDECIIRSALGKKPDGLWYEWNPLWLVDDKETAVTEKAKSDSWKIDVDSGLFNEDLLREARSNQISESGVYPGWDDLVAEWGTEPPEPTPEELAAQAALLGGMAPAANSNLPPKIGGAPTPGAKKGTLPPNDPKAKAVPAKGPVPAAAPAKKKVAGDALFEENRIRAADAMRAMHHAGYAVARVPKFAQGAGKFTTTQKGALSLIMQPHETEKDTEAYKLHQKDMAPTALYVRRDVLNGAAILAHYKKQAPKIDWESVDELHVTIMYTLTPVDWMKAGSDSYYGEDDGTLNVKPGGPRVHELFGAGGVIVLAFANSGLSWRHEDIKWRTKCEYDYETYQPHITLAKVGATSMAAIQALEPWNGAIELGPEVFEEANASYSSDET